MTNSRHYLSPSHLITISYQPNFLLETSGGSLEIWGYTGQDGQLLDKIDISPLITEKSLYPQTQDRRICRVFNQVELFSPGFSELALSYFTPPSSSSPCVS